MKARSIISTVDRGLLPDEQARLERFSTLVATEGGDVRLVGREIHAKLIALDMRQAEALLAPSNGSSTGPLAALYRRIERIGAYGLRGGKRVFVGFNDERKVVGRKKKEVSRRRHYYASDSFSRKVNELPPDFRNAILTGDSEEVLRSLPDACVDLIFTSPPYNFGLDYSDNGDDAEFWQAYFDKLLAVFDQCIRVLKYGGRLVINLQPLFSDYIPTHHIISAELMQRGLIWKGEILWEKNNYNCKYTAWGSYRSPSSPYLKYTWEFVEVFCKGSLVHPGYSSNSDLTDEEFKQWVVAKWSIAPERRMRELEHPAVFPEALADRVIRLFSFKGDVVLDPFNGVGTTTLVAARTGRTFVGVDVSPDYNATAQRRIDEATRQQSLAL